MKVRTVFDRPDFFMFSEILYCTGNGTSCRKHAVNRRPLQGHRLGEAETEGISPAASM